MRAARGREKDFNLMYYIIDNFNRSLLQMGIQFFKAGYPNFKTCKVSFRELTPIEIEKQIV